MDSKVVIITGASEGLGKGTAQVFAYEGWNVVIAARTKDRLEMTANELRSAGYDVLAVPTDVADPEQVNRLISKTIETYGNIDVLINSAGIDHAKPIDELEISEWKQVIDVNLNGVFYTSKAAFSYMKRQKSGYIINISSVAGKKGWPSATAYCSSKFALTGFTQALSGEGKPYNIRCSVVYPGGMDTNWHRERTPDFLDPKDCGRFLLHMVTQAPGFVINEAVISPIVEMGYP